MLSKTNCPCSPCTGKVKAERGTATGKLVAQPAQKSAFQAETNYVFLAFLHYIFFSLSLLMFCFVYASRSRLKHFVRARSSLFLIHSR